MGNGSVGQSGALTVLNFITQKTANWLELLLRRKIPKKRRGNADKHGDAKTVRHRFFFGFFFDDCVKVQECICKTAF